jgi:hypothetical protein
MTEHTGEQADNRGGSSDGRLVEFGPQAPLGHPDVVFAANPLSPVAESRSLGLEIQRQGVILVLERGTGVTSHRQMGNVDEKSLCMPPPITYILIRAWKHLRDAVPGHLPKGGRKCSLCSKSEAAITMATVSGSNVQVASNQHKVHGALHAAQSGLECAKYMVRIATGLMSA